MILLLKLLLAHLLGDFIFQPHKWVEDKQRKMWTSPYLYLHVFIHFVLIMVLVWDMGFWRNALLLTGIHMLIDVFKIDLSNKKNIFLIDQALHIITIVAFWYIYTHSTPDISFINDERSLLYIIGFIFISKPASVAIREVMKGWSADVSNLSTGSDNLVNAGEFIGYIERVLVLIMILNGQWEAIGFLIAAKSVFRFGDLKEAAEKKLTEYVLIGTLLSFGIAIITGLIITQIV